MHTASGSVVCSSISSKKCISSKIKLVAAAVSAAVLLLCFQTKSAVAFSLTGLGSAHARLGLLWLSACGVD
jgi:hypothetical protein